VLGLLAALLWAGLGGVVRADGGPAPKGEECDAVHACVVDPVSHVCEIPVTLAADGVLRITVQEDDPGAFFDARWRIFTAGGTAAPACGDFREATANDCGPLPAGEYRVQVASATATTGSATVHVQHQTGCASTLLGCDQHATDEIATVVDTDLFRFSLAGEEVVRITVREESGALQAEWRILTAAGLPATVCGGFQRSLSADCGPLAPGDYQLQVRDELVGATGTFAVHFQRLTAAYACEGERIGCDQLVAAPIGAPVDSDLYRLSLTTTDTLRVSVAGKTGLLVPEWRLLSPEGLPVAPCDAFTTVAVGDCGPLAPGDYQLQVKDDVARHAGDYELAFTFVGRGCPTCGNGVRQGAEHCDPPGDCCTALCRFAAADMVCRPTAGPCDRTERCTGMQGTCPENLFIDAGTECGDLGPCGFPRACTGTDVSCPAAFIPPDSECRECTAPIECTDADPCTSEDCQGGVCVSIPPAGFSGLDCELVKLLGGRPCGAEPFDRRLARLLGKRGAKARRLLAQAKSATTPEKQARLLGRVDRQLAAMGAKTKARAGHLSETCADTLARVFEGTRALVAALAP
jgi:hypothetical protein